MRPRQPLWRDLGAPAAQQSVEGAWRASQDNRDHYPVFARVPGRNGRGYAFVPLDKSAVLTRTKGKGATYTFHGFAGEVPKLTTVDIARAIDILLSDYPLDTLGAMHGLAFFVLRGHEDLVGDDEVCGYYLITARGYSFGIQSCFVRDKCQNTLNAGYSKALTDFSLFRGTSTPQELEYRLNMFPLLRQAEAQALEGFRVLANTPVSKAQALRAIRRTYPEITPPRRLRMASLLEATGAVAHPSEGSVAASKQRWEGRVAAARERRDLALQLFQGTNAWQLFNAIVEAEDYHRLNRGAGSAYELLFGRRAAVKERALAACLQV